jgi:hypothetical protein
MAVRIGADFSLFVQYPGAIDWTVDHDSAFNNIEYLPDF